MTTATTRLYRGTNYATWQVGDRQLFVRFFGMYMEICENRWYFNGSESAIDPDAMKVHIEYMIQRMLRHYDHVDPMPISASRAALFFAAGIIEPEHLKPNNAHDFRTHQCVCIHIAGVKLSADQSAVTLRVMSDQDYAKLFAIDPFLEGLV